jgi:hypothetical protein
MAKHFLSSLSVGANERFAAYFLSCVPIPSAMYDTTSLLRRVGEGFVGVGKDLFTFLFSKYDKVKIVCVSG